MNNKTTFNHPEDDDGDFLDLSLGPKKMRLPSPPPPPHLPSQRNSIPSSTRPQIPSYSPRMQSLYIQTPLPNPVIQLPSSHPLYIVPPEVLVAKSPSPPRMYLNERPSRQGRSRRNPSQNNGEDNNRTIPPPYPWATDRTAVVHSLRYLRDSRIETITGMLRCTKCDKDYDMEFDLEEKMRQFWDFVRSKKGTMHDRAPKEWSSPPTLTCKYCSGEGVKPIISENKENINWLFLFLGQLLGCCTLEQLKYFCGCTRNHRTGAKDRVLYLTYLEIFKQLLPGVHVDSW